MEDQVKMEGSYVFPTSSIGPGTANSSKPTDPIPTSSSSSSIKGSSSTPPTPTLAKPHVDQQERKKVILRAATEGDTSTLRRMAGDVGGFVDTEGRRAAWPILLGVEKDSKKNKVVARKSQEGKTNLGGDEAPAEEEDEPKPHEDEGQVRLDVNRSFVSYPADISNDEKEALRLKLTEVIHYVLRRHPALSYFQGYHDIISVLLLVLDDIEVTKLASERMTLHRIRDSLGPGLEPVLGYLKLLLRILEKEDAALARTIELAAALPYFSLSWVLTLLSHDLTSLDVIARLFDFLLAHNPAMVSYFGVAIILHKKEELALLDEDSAEDPAILHHTLSQLPNLFDESTAPPPPPAEPETDEEDLMSNRSRSPSLSTSYLTESIMSTDTEDDIDALDDSMLSDPDVTGPAFIEVPRPRRPSTPPPPPPPPVSIDKLIAKALELYSTYPVSGEKGIKADEVMGSKSCIFTWSLSQEGLLSDEEAEDIIAKGVDIIISEALEPTKEKPSEVEKKKLTRRSRRREVGLGTALAVVGVAGVLLAIYGLDVRSSKIGGWRLGDFWRGAWW